MITIPRTHRGRRLVTYSSDEAIVLLRKAAIPKGFIPDVVKIEVEFRKPIVKKEK